MSPALLNKNANTESRESPWIQVVSFLAMYSVGPKRPNCKPKKIIYNTSWFQESWRRKLQSTTQPNAEPATEIVPPTSPNNALATKSETPTWPNIAPGTTPVLLLQYYPAKCSPNNALATATWPNIAPGTTPVLLLQYYPAKCCTCHRNCLSNITKQCACHQKLTLQHDQILLLALLHYYYSSTTQPNAAPATEIVSPTSPNTALVTKSDTPTWPNIAPGTTPVLLLQYYPAKCCTCHRNCHSNITALVTKSDTPTWPNIAPGTTPVLLLQYYPAKCCTCHRNCLSNITKQCACHQKLTLQHDQILLLALLHYYYYSSTTQPNAAPATEIVSPTLPNNALATKNWHSNMTKYCSWHYSTTTTPVLPSQMLHLPQKLSLQHYQTMRLPLTLQHDQILLLQYYYSSTTQPNAAPATEIVSPTLPNNALATKNWHSNMTKYCSWHYSTTTTPVLPSQMLHLPQKLSLQHHCACHKKWHSNMTKYCAWHYSSTTTPVLPSQMLHLPQKLSLQHHQTMRLPRKVTLQHDQILRMPRKVTPQQFLRSQATKNSGHKRPKIAVTSDPPPLIKGN